MSFLTGLQQRTKRPGVTYGPGSDDFGNNLGGPEGFPFIPNAGTYAPPAGFDNGEPYGIGNQRFGRPGVVYGPGADSSGNNLGGPAPFPVRAPTTTRPPPGFDNGEPYSIDRVVGDEQERFDFFNSLDDRIKAPALLTTGEIRTERARQIADRNRALGRLDTVRDLRQGAYDDFLNDEDRELVLQFLREGASGEREAISQEELSASRLTLAQMFATGEANTLNAQAARGSDTGGTRLGTEVARGAVVTGQGLQLAAQRQGLNRQFQTANASALSRAINARDVVGSAFISDMERLAATSASIEQSVTFDPIDYTSFAQLDFAIEAYETALQQSIEATEFAEGQAEFNFRDAIEIALLFAEVLPGTGLFNTIFNN